MARTGRFDRDDTMTALGQFIRSRRRELGLTQTQLGARIGYYQERISALECGTYGVPSLNSLHDLAGALEVPVESLLAKSRCLSLDPEETTLCESVPSFHKLLERQAQLRDEYDRISRRLAETETLLEEMLRLREQIAEQETALRQVSVAHAEIAR